MQISMTRNSCKLALKELKSWMKPDKVITVANLEMSLKNLKCNTKCSDNIFSGQNSINNVSIFGRNCFRTPRCCVGHLNLELPLLYGTIPSVELSTVIIFTIEFRVSCFVSLFLSFTFWDLISAEIS